MDLLALPSQVRQLCRDGELDAPTPGLALGYAILLG